MHGGIIKMPLLKQLSIAAVVVHTLAERRRLYNCMNLNQLTDLTQVYSSSNSSS